MQKEKQEYLFQGLGQVLQLPPRLLCHVWLTWLGKLAYSLNSSARLSDLEFDTPFSGVAPAIADVPVDLTLPGEEDSADAPGDGGDRESVSWILWK